MKNKKTYELNLLDRISIPQVLPDKGSIEKAIICEDIREKIRITQDELKNTELKTYEDGHMTWNESKDVPLKVTFTELETELIASGFKKLNKEESIPTAKGFIKLYKMFVED